MDLGELAGGFEFEEDVIVIKTPRNVCNTLNDVEMVVKYLLCKINVRRLGLITIRNMTKDSQLQLLWFLSPK